jgi:hypothetical protein
VLDAFDVRAAFELAPATTAIFMDLCQERRAEAVRKSLPRLAGSFHRSARG